jgi:tetratricopeptide (TPR) repeat protein
MLDFRGFDFFLRRPVLYSVLFLLGLATTVVGGKIAWRHTHLRVFFDNGLTVPVTIHVDGTTFRVGAGAHVERSLPPGSHDVTVTGPAGEIERYTADIPAPSPLDAFGAPGFFVYDVSDIHAYLLEEISYSPKKEEHRRTYRSTVFGLQRFLAQDAVDHLFRQAPDWIPADGTDAVKKRTAFTVAPGGLVDYAVDRADEGDFKEAEKALRKALALAPCGTPEHRTLLNVLWRQNRPEMVLAEARAWTACPGLDPHRYYQENMRRAGQEQAVLAEYRKRLAEHPEIGANHYLYGRLLKDLDQQIAAFRAAVQRDPGLTRAQIALGTALLGKESYAEAFEELGHALDLPDRPDDLYLTYAQAAVGAGTPGPADQELKKRSGGKPEGIETVAEARWLLALAGGRYDDALSLLNAHEDAAPHDSTVWRHRVLLLRFTGKRDKLDRELERAARRADLAHDLAQVHLELALDEKRFRDAAAVVDKEMAAFPEGPEDLGRLYGAAALLLAGDTQAADEHLTRLAADLRSDPVPDSNAGLVALLAGVLRRSQPQMPPAEVVRKAANIDYQSLPHAYFILGVRATAAGDSAAAGDFFAKSRKTALDLEFPYLEAGGLATSPPSPTAPPPSAAGNR